MQREIKFRAWDKFEGKWLFGYEYPNLGGFSLIGEVVLFGELAKFSLDYYQHIIFMQFTGLQDDANEDLYDGDIIVDISGNVLSIEWNDDTLRWQLSDGSPLNDGDRYGTYKRKIGNIYENPDLLK